MIKIGITVEELEIVITAQVAQALMEMRKVKEELTNMVSHAAPAIQRQMDAVTSSVEQPMKQMKESVQKSAYVIAKEQARLSAQMSVIQAKAQAQIETALVKEEAKRIKAQQVLEKQKQAEQARADVVKQTAEDIIRQQKEIEDAVKRSMERIAQVSQGGKYTPRQDTVTGASRLASSIDELKQRMASVASQAEQATDNVKISFEHLNGSATAALDNLNAKIELQKQRLIQLMNEYRQAVDQFGEQSKEAITLRGRMINLEGTINNMIGRSDKLAETLRKVAEAERLAAEEARNMGLPVPINTEGLSVTIQKLEEIRDKSKEINRGGLGGNAADKTAKSIQNVKNRTESAAQSMRKFANTAKSSAGKASRAFLKLGDIIKNTLIIGGLYKSFCALFGFIRDGIQSAINAPEIENMFRVALGNMAGEAEQFSVRFKKALGVDEYATKQMLGTFHNMITTMGIGTQTAYKMSKSLTILANDMASLYNVPVEQAFENLQSALSDQSEVVRKYGYVITENVIKQTAWKYGIAETGKKLNENQKVLARYLAILEQSKNAQGDMARTAGSLQNQLRILKGNIDAAGRALGGAFLPFIKAVIPWLNALAVVVQRLGTMLAKFTYNLFGLNYEEEKKKQEQITGGLGDLADAEENLGDKAEETGEKAESALMGFDQLNVLQNHQDDDLPDFDLPPIEMPDVPSLDVPENTVSPFEKLADKILAKFQEVFDKIKKALEPTIEAFKGLWKELERLGGFAWEGLKDFYETFLKPLGKWVLGTGLPRLVEIITQGLARIDWGKINNALHVFWEALEPFAEKVGEGLLWFLENVLVPLGTWVMNDAVPEFLKALAAVLESPVWDEAGKVLVELYENFFKPIANWVGDKIIEFLQWIQENGDTTARAIIAIGIAFAAWKIGKGIFNFVNWAKESTVVKGVGKLFNWLKGKIFGVNDAMGDKNKTLKQQTKDTQRESSQVWKWVASLGAAGAAVMSLGKTLKDFLPQSFKFPDFGNVFGGQESPSFESGKIPAPSFETPVAPAIDTKTEFEPSKEQYRQPVHAPSVNQAFASEMNLEAFQRSVQAYSATPILAPTIAAAVVPGLDLATRFLPSMIQLKQNFEQLRTDLNAKTESIKNGLQSAFNQAMSYVANCTAQGSRSALNSYASGLSGMARSSEDALNGMSNGFYQVFSSIAEMVSQATNATANNLYNFYTGSLQMQNQWGSAMAQSTAQAAQASAEVELESLKVRVQNFMQAAAAMGQKIHSAVMWISPKLMIAQNVGGLIAAATVTAPMWAPAALSLIKPVLVKIASTLLPGAVFAAKGAVLTGPQLLMAGEYSGASSNPEIVSPQSIMSETFLQSLVPLINAIEEGIRSVIDALKQIDFSPILNLDGTNLVRALKPYQNRENRLNGTPLFTY